MFRIDKPNRCVVCLGTVSQGIISYNIYSSEVKYITADGSYMLPNGIIMLTKMDLDDYNKGGLQFFNKFENLNTLYNLSQIYN